jgi:hypothetical protein
MITEIINISVVGNNFKITYVIRSKKKAYQTSIPTKILSNLDVILGDQKNSVLQTYVTRTHKEYYELDLTEVKLILDDEEIIKKKLEWIK